MISLYDAHNHLQDERLASRLEEILRKMPSLGISCCVVNGTCENDWPAVAALAKRFDWIIPAFGLHPWFAKERSAGWFDALRRFLDQTPRATVGEIGLDRWIEDYDLADQEKVFVAQLEIAAGRNVTASIHCLKAWGHLEDVMKTHKLPARGFLLHSYGGSADVARSLAKLGGYFSISGYFAHDRKAQQREIFKTIPIDRFLVETDAPDMLPPPAFITHPSEDANDPRNLPKIYEFAARLVGLPLEAFAKRVEANFNSLLCFAPGDIDPGDDHLRLRVHPAARKYFARNSGVARQPPGVPARGRQGDRFAVPMDHGVGFAVRAAYGHAASLRPPERGQRTDRHPRQRYQPAIAGHATSAVRAGDEWRLRLVQFKNHA